MLFEANFYKAQFESFCKMLNDWYKDLVNFEETINAKKDKSVAVAGMEISLNKGINRYQEAMNTAGAANEYIKALQDEIERLIRRNNELLSQQRDHSGKRTRICDLPSNQNY